MTPADLLSLRHRVPDGVLLDALELNQMVQPFLGCPDPPRLSTEQLQAHWHCSQPAVSRRMNALVKYGLAEVRTTGGRGARWTVRRIGLCKEM